MCGKGIGPKCADLSKFLLKRITDPKAKISNKNDIIKLYGPIEKLGPKELKQEVGDYLMTGRAKPAGFRPKEVFVDRMMERIDDVKEEVMAHFNVEEANFENKMAAHK